jgi:hypothetical protein
MHLLAATSTPSPTPTVAAELVTPGPWGFLVIALLALAVVVLVWDMQRRIRRARYREEVAAELDALEASENVPDDPDAAPRGGSRA